MRAADGPATKRCQPSCSASSSLLASVQLSAPGGLPQEAHLQPETKLWQPPAALPQPGGGDPYALGQVPGLAARGDGTVWAFHRGHRAWNPDGSVSDGGEGEVLAGPTVFQVGERTEAGARH